MQSPTEAGQVVSLETLDARPIINEQHCRDAMARADAALVESEQDDANAADLWKILDAHEKALLAERKTWTDPLDALRKKVMDRFRPWAEGIPLRKTRLKQLQTAFRNKREQERLAEEKRLKDEQDRIAMEKAAAEEAEAKRLADEARAAQEAGDAAKAAELAQQAQEQQQQAAATLEAAAEAPAPVVPPPAPVRGAYAGSSNRIVWKAKIENMALLMPAIIGNEKIRDAAEKVVGAMVRAGTRTIPGVKIWSEKDVVNR